MKLDNLRNWQQTDSHKVVRGIFLDFVAWIRAGDNHLGVAEDDIHNVAALLTQAQITHYEANTNTKTRMPLDDAIGDEQ
tara:strand:+ start:437 stop:673 length:237 start_codon:yes stop_codon:yes gene_type:complete